MQRLEAVVHLDAELVERRVHARRVQELRQPRAVAVEVRLEHRADPADRGVSPAGVEELVDHRLQLAAVAQERLQRARQTPAVVAEVGPEHLLQRRGRLLVGGAALVREPVELGANGVHVQGHAHALERGQPDAKRAFDQDRVVVRRLGAEPGCKGAVGQRTGARPRCGHPPGGRPAGRWGN